MQSTGIIWGLSEWILAGIQDRPVDSTVMLVVAGLIGIPLAAGRKDER